MAEDVEPPIEDQAPEPEAPEPPTVAYHLGAPALPGTDQGQAT